MDEDYTIIHIGQTTKSYFCDMEIIVCIDVDETETIVE